MQSYLFLLAVLVALLVGLAAGKAWERYKLVEGRWIDRRRVRRSPFFILGLNHLVAGRVDLAIEALEKASGLDPGAFELRLVRRGGGRRPCARRAGRGRPRGRRVPGALER